MFGEIPAVLLVAFAISVLVVLVLLRWRPPDLTYGGRTFTGPLYTFSLGLFLLTLAALAFIFGNVFDSDLLIRVAFVLGILGLVIAVFEALTFYTADRYLVLFAALLGLTLVVLFSVGLVTALVDDNGKNDDIATRDEATATPSAEIINQEPKVIISQGESNPTEFDPEVLEGVLRGTRGFILDTGEAEIKVQLPEEGVQVFFKSEGEETEEGETDSNGVVSFNFEVEAPQEGESGPTEELALGYGENTYEFEVPVTFPISQDDGAVTENGTIRSVDQFEDMLNGFDDVTPVASPTMGSGITPSATQAVNVATATATPQVADPDIITVGVRIDAKFREAFIKFCGFNPNEISLIELIENDQPRYQVAFVNGEFVRSPHQIPVGQWVWAIRPVGDGDICYLNPPCGNPEVTEGEVPPPPPGFNPPPPGKKPTSTPPPGQASATPTPRREVRTVTRTPVSTSTSPPATKTPTPQVVKTSTSVAPTATPTKTPRPATQTPAPTIPPCCTPVPSVARPTDVPTPRNTIPVPTNTPIATATQKPQPATQTPVPR